MPGSAPGPPRRSSRLRALLRGCDVSDFILDGYWDFNTALNAVGKHLFGDAWDWQEPAIPSVEDFISEQVSLADGVRLMKETAGPLDPWQLDSALDWLRQRLHAKTITIPRPSTDGRDRADPVFRMGKNGLLGQRGFVGKDRVHGKLGPAGGSITRAISGCVLFRIKDVEKELSPPAPAKRGRPPKSGSYEKSDIPWIEEMRRLIGNGDAKLVWEAAGAVAERAEGGGVLESRRKRLAKRYSEKYRHRVPGFH